jgi:hypothetical protein
MNKLLGRLKGGDRRSIGRSDELVRSVPSNETEFETLVNGLANGDPLVRMRAADACEKVSRMHPEWLLPHKKRLLDIALSTGEEELKWHLAQMLPRLRLTTAERPAVIALLRRFLRGSKPHRARGCVAGVCGSLRQGAHYAPTIGGAARPAQKRSSALRARQLLKAPSFK